ncbi:DEAD/DEAH box helicase [Chryseobacterium sp. 3008163]|uniref:DEAD/DEAH box helicase n=1 Tax=Chryseobacterium sp. 3008163 TaxID=2478663 RepID=UPI002938FF0E|nr:DEAD/DEAH box helicase [Chryseobacterium sp. 3008163]
MSNEGYIESLEQNSSRKSIINSEENEIAYIAPTSYGKSSLIADFIEKNNPKKVGIIVPTKSLLVQTYNDIKKSNNYYKLVLHDEMYNIDDEKFIGILTQERATRILNSKSKSFFDVIFIDEAHNLFKRDSRSFILSRLIQLNYKRNPNQKIIYLSPLVEDESNLKIKKTKDGTIYTRKVQHDFKSFELFYFDKNKSYFYDRFTGRKYDLKKDKNYFEYIIDNSSNKNFIYQLKPKLTEKLALELSSNINIDLSKNENIEKIINTLKKEVHPEFQMIECLKKGIVYIHGKIPNLIKEYIERQFKEIDEIEFIVANTVILEGINLPIETIFITTNKAGKQNERLDIKSLINLIGRANRLNYVFDENSKDIDKLISRIHFLEHDTYHGKKGDKNQFSIFQSLKKLNENKLFDLVKNPIIETYDIENLKFTGENKVANKEKHRKEDNKLLEHSDFVLEPPKSENERIKKYFIENSIEKYFDNLEEVIEIILINIQNYDFDFNHKIVDIIYEILIVNNVHNLNDFEIDRLKNEKARDYYNYYIDVTQKQHLNQRINSVLNHFHNKIKHEDPFLYIGTGYGDTTSIDAGKSSRYEQLNNKYRDWKNVYINLKYTEQSWVNLAIVKLKIEEDFVSFQLTLLMSFLYDFNIIPKDYYYQYIYGTTDERVINLVRFGLTVSVINKLEIDNQIENLELDKNGNLRPKNKIEFENYLINQAELFQFEIRKYLN